MGQSYPALRGNPKFDRCFQWGNWRQVDQLFFMPHDKGYDAFFGAGWKTTYLVYDEDDDDHRWERIEMYYPMHGFRLLLRAGGPVPSVGPEAAADRQRREGRIVILDAFIPHPDVRERFDTLVEAPASLVLDTACGMDLQSLPIARAIFRLREVIMRAPAPRPRRAQGILAETLSLGWGLLARDERMVVVGARCQPWRGDVTFTAISPDAFASYAEPDQVKIAWTLEVEALGPARTRFSHETRAVATDAEARRRFLRYWRWARFGIIAIGWLMMPGVRRESEARWAQRSTAGA